MSIEKGGIRIRPGTGDICRQCVYYTEPDTVRWVLDERCYKAWPSLIGTDRHPSLVNLVKIRLPVSGVTMDYCAEFEET